MGAIHFLCFSSLQYSYRINDDNNYNNRDSKIVRMSYSDIIQCDIFFGAPFQAIISRLLSVLRFGKLTADDCNGVLLLRVISYEYDL